VRRVFRVVVPAPRARWRFARGAPGPAVCWAAEVFGLGPFFALGHGHAGCDLRLADLIVLFYYF
jgi:hypothetical protein